MAKNKNTASKKTKKLGAVPVAALALTGVGAGVAVPAVSAIVAPSANAASVTATNVKVTTPLTDGQEVRGGQTISNITDSWTVPTGAKAGDTSTISFDNPPVVASAISNAPIKDASGNVIATINGPINGPFTVTYTDYVETHVNVNASYTFSIGFTGGTVEGTTMPVTSTVDGTSQTPLHVKVTAPGNIGIASASLSGSNTMGEIPAGTPMTLVDHFSFNPVTAADVGKTLTVTQTIGDIKDGQEEGTNNGNSVFDCETALNSNTHLLYTAANYDSDGNRVDNYGVNGQSGDNYYNTNFSDTSFGKRTSNPFQVKVTSCTPTTITYSWVPTKAGDQISFFNRTMSDDGYQWVAPYNIVKLTPQAIANQVTGMYYYDTTMDSAKPQSLSAHGFVAFDAANGSGQAYPTAVDDSATTPYNTPVTLNSADNDKVSALGTTLDKSSVAVAQSDGTFSKNAVTTADGTWTPDGNGNIKFTPAAGFTGTATIKYQISDTAGLTSTATETVTVSDASAPTATDDTANTPFNTPVVIDELSNDKITQDGATWSKVTLTDASGNQVNTVTNSDGTYTVGDDNKVTFTPATGFSGVTTPVTYTATDSNGKSATAKITVTVSDAASPTAANDTDKTPFNTPVTTNVLANDTLTEKGSTWKSVTINGAGADGTLTNSDGTYKVGSDNQITFTPAPGFSGTATAITYTATDSDGKSATATYTVTVGDAAAPTATDDAATTPFNTPVVIDELSNDTLNQAGSTWSKVTLTDASGNQVNTVTNSDGTYTVGDDNKVTFTPATGFTGVTTPVTYTATDSNGKSATAKITVTVADASSPAAADDTATTPFNTPVTSNVLTNDTVSQEGATFTKVELKGADGTYGSTLTNSDGTYTVGTDNQVTFTPAKGFTGVATSIDYRATDSNGKTADAKYTVTVGDAAAPTATPDANSTPFNTPVVTNVLTNDKVNQDGATFTKVELKGADGTYGSTLTNSDGTYTVGTDNQVTFTPAKGYTGTATAITYRATDSNGKTAESTLTITVADAKAPAAADDNATTPFNTPTTLKVLDNDTLSETGATWTKVTLLDASGKSVDTVTNTDGTYKVNADNTVTFTPAKGFTGVTTPVSYSATDSNGKSATAKITVTVGDATAPTANPDTNKTPYGTAVTTKVLDNDKLGETGSTWTKVQLKDADGKLVDTLTNSDGTYKVNADNTVTFTPANGFTGVAKSVDYVATDSNGKTATSTLTITVGDKPKSTPTTTPTQKPTPTPTKSNTPAPTVTPTQKPTPTPTKVVTPVVGPTVQTDYVGGSSSATDIAGIMTMAGLLGGGIFAAKKSRKSE